jgi:hypothetical protein
VRLERSGRSGLKGSREIQVRSVLRVRKEIRAQLARKVFRVLLVQPALKAILVRRGLLDPPV